jgi:pentatricopeptide repeat protein
MASSGAGGACPDLRALFLADQSLLAGGPGPPGPRPGPEAPASGVVGWGGAVLPQDLSSARVPWFGRSRKVPAHRVRAGSSHGGGGGPGGGGASGAPPPGAPHAPGTPGAAPPPCALPGAGSMSSAGSGGLLLDDAALSVDELVAAARAAPRGARLPERVLRSLHGLDSRAVALLLKDLSKAGLDERAIELFDWLRGLPERHALRALCDVYTYTAMISLCIYQQSVDRAMELLGEMRARRVERNVHTYTALMNVCIKVRSRGGGGGRAAAAGRRLVGLAERRLGACPGLAAGSGAAGSRQQRPWAAGAAAALSGRLRAAAAHPPHPSPLPAPPQTPVRQDAGGAGDL